MTYHFTLCDDDAEQLIHLQDLVRQWAAGRHCHAQIETFPSAEAFLFRYAAFSSFDILLLDIEMGKMNGVELARTIRAGNKDAQIIFITGYMEYIADGYEVDALHYLIKPVEQMKLLDTLDRAAAKLARNQRALLLDISGESVRVPLHEIKYLEVRRNYVTVFANESYTVKATLGELSNKLDENFYKTGRSYIVNLQCIKRVSKTDIYLTDGVVIPLPRGQYEAVNKAIINIL